MTAESFRQNRLRTIQRVGLEIVLRMLIYSDCVAIPASSWGTGQHTLKEGPTEGWSNSCDTSENKHDAGRNVGARQVRSAYGHPRVLAKI